jgi:hypothetical protein
MFVLHICLNYKEGLYVYITSKIMEITFWILLLQFCIIHCFKYIVEL